MIEIHVNDPEGTGADLEALERAVRLTLADGACREAEISLTLVGDDAIRALNRRYLDRDRVTDVIAFTLSGPGEPLLADLYVGHAQAARQAEGLGVELPEELTRLAVHATLHALGHDHPDEDRESSPLFARQERLVRRSLAD